MKKRTTAFIKSTSNKNKTSNKTAASSKKTQKSITKLLGWIDRSNRRDQFMFIPFNKEFTIPIFIKKEEIKNHELGLHAIVRVLLGDKIKKGRLATIDEVFKSIDDPELEVDIVCENYGFPIDFTDDLLRAAEKLKDQPDQEARTDLTQEIMVTIDGEDAKDFDDAIGVKKEGNNYRLYVSIADVSFFVKEGGPIDVEAFLRGTSIYFPGQCIPMLPEVLSNNLCSLVPKEERKTLTCELLINQQGEILKRKVYASKIKSARRCTYTEVGALLQKGASKNIPQAISEMLFKSFELSKILRKRRQDLGYLDLDLPEIKMEVDQFGDVTYVGQAERNEAHRMIEDFMIIANEMVSEMIEAADFDSLFRVHADPAPEKIDRLKTIAKIFRLGAPKGGHDISELLQNFLVLAKDHPQEKALVLSLLRSLMQAEYSANNVGHFGLGSPSYCHFTSPIRRYPDLVIHRILRQTSFLSKNTPPYTRGELDQIASQSSDLERRAFYAEREMKDLKKCRFLKDWVGKKVDGRISSVKAFGFFVELEGVFIEGLVPKRTLPRDFWEIDEHELCLSGRRSRQKFKLGDKIKVQIYQIDRYQRQISFRYLEHLDK